MKIHITHKHISSKDIFKYIFSMLSSFFHKAYSSVVKQNRKKNPWNSWIQQAFQSINFYYALWKKNLSTQISVVKVWMVTTEQVWKAFWVPQFAIPLLWWFKWLFWIKEQYWHWLIKTFMLRGRVSHHLWWTAQKLFSALTRGNTQH